MSTTSRLSLHKPDSVDEKFGDYFPTAYAADLQQIDDVVQIKNVGAAGNIPVYDENGLLEDSGIAPEDLEAGLISSLLTTQGMMLYKGASDLAALAADTAGKSLLTQGAGADPVFGYPSHATLLNLTVGDPHTQYLLRSVLSVRGDLAYRGASDWARLAKGLAGQALFQGDNDPYWATRYFEIDFPFGNGQDVIENHQYHEVAVPINCKITRVDFWEIQRIAGAATAELYIHDLGAARGDQVDNFVIAAGQSYYNESGLNIAVSQHKVIQIVLGYTSTAKQVVVRLFCEAT